MRKKWGKWNSRPLGTVRLATALGPTGANALQQWRNFAWGCLWARDGWVPIDLEAFGQSETNRSAQHTRALLLKGPREVNNRLTGWVFAHLVNYFAHPVNSTCPLPITAHPVNYLAHRKMGTSIIETRQSRWKFLQNGQPKRWNTFSCTLKIRNSLEICQDLVCWTLTKYFKLCMISCIL